MALGFATDIRPLFRDGDIECMKSAGVLLDNGSMDERARERRIRSPRSELGQDASGRTVAERSCCSLQAMDGRRLSSLANAIQLLRMP